MTRYYVNNEAHPSGEHEVHTINCSHLPSNRQYLGDFNNCFEAVQKAKDHYSNVDGCYWCCKPCHTR